MHICCIEGSYLENWGLQWIQLIHEDLFQGHNLQQQLNVIWMLGTNSKSNLCLNVRQYSSIDTKKKKHKNENTGKQNKTQHKKTVLKQIKIKKKRNKQISNCYQLF